MSTTQLPFNISVLVFLRHEDGRLLLIQRRKSPNHGCWSPIGGKLEMARGESPFECAAREVGEEARLKITTGDLRLFGYVSEKGYEGAGHWLMFLFDCTQKITALPAEIDEGRFAFFTRDAINSLKIPPTDHQLVWPYYDSHRERFIALRANCSPERELEIVVEQSM